VINIYIYSSCTSCRKTESVLNESGVAFTSRDYFRDRFTREELASLLTTASLAPSNVLSRRSKVYGARRDEIDALADDTLLDLMVEEPTLLRRPILIGNGGVVVGHNAGKLADLISGSLA